MGGEINASKKDPSRVKVRVALAFPDSYEIGMSYLGLKILYEIINSDERYLAERVYTPWTDMEAMMRKANVKLPSLESRTPLDAFDVIGFTLPYELCFTNILSILDLAKIPLLAADRDKSYPLIIGGGSGVFNPEPLADFFDVFVLGDGEEVLLEILETVGKYKDSSKSALLEALAERDGVYVPTLIDIDYHPNGSVSDIRSRHPLPIRKRLIRDLENAPVPEKIIVPYQAIVHDRITEEITRGCSHGCRFCQAGMIYRPVRERSPGRVVSCLSRTIANTGYDEVSLASLSSGDFSRMDDLIYLLREFPSLSVSLPSMRPDTLTPSMIEFIRSVRKTGFTIAPEAGTQRLRDLINKKITEEDILSTAQRIFEAGWEGLKLYFMIGLPTETEEDILGIVQLTNKIHRIARRYRKRKCFINIGISTFTPKPHTPFQWHPQEKIESIRAKILFLKKHLFHKNFSLKWQDASTSFLEGTLSLGSRQEGRVIHRAFLDGCRFDAWTDLFHYERWEKAFALENLDPERFLYRKKESSEILPWDHLETGVSKEFLWKEYQNALTGTTTPDCRSGQCSECGICDTFDLDRQMPLKNNTTSLGPAIKKQGPRLGGMKPRLRLRYTKTAPMYLLSHLDLSRVFIRAMRRVCIPVKMSEGFHPHPKIAFGPALSVGMEGECEYIDIELDQYMDKDSLINKVNRTLPAGITITEGGYIDNKASSLIKISDQHSYRIIVGKNSSGLFEKIGSTTQETVPRKISDFLEKDQILIRRGKKNLLFDIKPYLIRLAQTHCEDNSLEMELVLNVPEQGSINPRNVLALIFDLSPEEIPGIRIIRTAISQIDPLTGITFKRRDTK